MLNSIIEACEIHFGNREEEGALPNTVWRRVKQRGNKLLEVDLINCVGKRPIPTKSVKATLRKDMSENSV